MYSRDFTKQYSSEPKRENLSGKIPPEYHGNMLANGGIEKEEHEHNEENKKMPVWASPSDDAQNRHINTDDILILSIALIVLIGGRDQKDSKMMFILLLSLLF